MLMRLKLTSAARRTSRSTGLRDVGIRGDVGDMVAMSGDHPAPLVMPVTVTVRPSNASVVETAGPVSVVM
jgi:hypothetical protein